MPDAQIVDGARRALIADPAASMAEIAHRGHVGKSALYARFPSREALLRHFAAEANVRYREALTGARRLLRRGQPTSEVLLAFMTDIVLADIHQLLLAVSGTFVRSAADVEESRRLRIMAEQLVRRAHTDGVLRPGVTWRDLFKAQEMIAGVQGATDEQTRNLRLRMLDVVFLGLTGGADPLVGDPPIAADSAENRDPRSGAVAERP